MTEAKGDEFVRDAVAAMQKGGWFFGPSKSEKASTAVDSYVKAANQFKIAKCFTKSGQAFNDAAQLCLEMTHGDYQAASNFTKAAEMFRKTDKIAAQKSLERSVKLFLDGGKFSSAAKNTQQLAEIAEEDSRLTDAIIAYEKACDYYEADNSPSTGMACLLKAAYLCIDCCEYDQAINVLERAATHYANNQLTTSKCKQLFFEAGILRMFLGDIVECKKSLTRYTQMLNTFIKSREYTMLDATIIAYESTDSEAFSNAVTEFDSIQPLQRWQTAILLAIKDKIEKEANAEEDMT